MKKLAPMTLKEWRADTGHSQRSLAEKLSTDQNYISIIETGKQVAGETFKESFRKMFPGYDVIEMRPDGAAAEPAMPEEPERVKPEDEVYGLMVEKRSKQSLSRPIEELFVLARGDYALAFKSRAEASEYLTEEILKDEEAYGWKLMKAELR